MPKSRGLMAVLLLTLPFLVTRAAEESASNPLKEIERSLRSLRDGPLLVLAHHLFSPEIDRGRAFTAIGAPLAPLSAGTIGRPPARGAGYKAPTKTYWNAVTPRGFEVPPNTDISQFVDVPEGCNVTIRGVKRLPHTPEIVLSVEARLIVLRPEKVHARLQRLSAEANRWWASQAPAGATVTCTEEGGPTGRAEVLLEAGDRIARQSEVRFQFDPPEDSDAKADFPGMWNRVFQGNPPR